MLDFISGILTSIADFFSSIWDFILSIFEESAYIVQLVSGFGSKIGSFFAFLPSSVLVLLVSLFGVVVVYKIAGRT